MKNQMKKFNKPNQTYLMKKEPKMRIPVPSQVLKSTTGGY